MRPQSSRNHMSTTTAGLGYLSQENWYFFTVHISTYCISETISPSVVLVDSLVFCNSQSKEEKANVVGVVWFFHGFPIICMYGASQHFLIFVSFHNSYSYIRGKDGGRGYESFVSHNLVVKW